MFLSSSIGLESLSLDMFPIIVVLRQEQARKFILKRINDKYLTKARVKLFSSRLVNVVLLMFHSLSYYYIIDIISVILSKNNHPSLSLPFVHYSSGK